MEPNLKEYLWYLKAKRRLRGVGVLLFTICAYLIGRMYVIALIEELVRELGRR